MAERMYQKIWLTLLAKGVNKPLAVQAKTVTQAKRIRKATWKEKDIWNSEQPETERGKYRLTCEIDEEHCKLFFTLTLATTVDNL